MPRRLLGRAGWGLDVRPGEEFRVAFREARAVGAQVVLGDRPASITFARTWAALGGWQKARLLASLLRSGAGCAALPASLPACPGPGCTHREQPPPALALA